MITLTTYLLLNGNCEEAMQFYQACLGGELVVAKVKDTAMKDMMPPSMHNKVIHARLNAEGIHISASDWLRPDQIPVQGNTVCLYLNGSALELKKLFDSLSAGGNITDPLKEQFSGMYGALNDKFGIRWMFHTS